MSAWKPEARDSVTHTKPKHQDLTNRKLKIRCGLQELILPFFFGKGISAEFPLPLPVYDDVNNKMTDANVRVRIRMGQDALLEGKPRLCLR